MKNILAIKNACYYSMNGFRYLIKERAYRQECIVFVILCVLELYRDTSICMRLYLFSSYMLIFFAEAVNSAVEATIDRIGLEHHELSKKAKDIASAAVFIAIVHFAIVWGLSFLF